MTAISTAVSSKIFYNNQTQEILNNNSRKDISIDIFDEPKNILSSFLTFVNYYISEDYSSLSGSSNEIELSNSSVIDENMDTHLLIRTIIRDILKESPIFIHGNITQIEEYILELINDIPFDPAKLPREKLYERIQKVLLIESLSNSLEDFSKSDLEEFDEIIRRKEFF